MLNYSVQVIFHHSRPSRLVKNKILTVFGRVKFHQYVPIGATVVKSGETMHIQALGGDTNQGIFFDLRQLHSKDLIPRFFKFCSFSQTSPLLLLTYTQFSALAGSPPTRITCFCSSKRNLTISILPKKADQI